MDLRFKFVSCQISHRNLNLTSNSSFYFIFIGFRYSYGEMENLNLRFSIFDPIQKSKSITAVTSRSVITVITLINNSRSVYNVIIITL